MKFLIQLAIMLLVVWFVFGRKIKKMCSAALNKDATDAGLPIVQQNKMTIVPQEVFPSGPQILHVQELGVPIVERKTENGGCKTC